MKHDKNILIDQIELNIDACIRDLVRLRDRVERIKTDCAEHPSALADVSTSALDSGLSAEFIAKKLNRRERRRIKHR